MGLTENTTTIYRLSDNATCTLPCLMRTPAQSHIFPEERALLWATTAQMFIKKLLGSACAPPPYSSTVGYYNGLPCSRRRNRCLNHFSQEPPSTFKTFHMRRRADGACCQGWLNPVRGTQCHRGQCRYRRTGRGCWWLRCSHRWRRWPCNSPVRPQPHYHLQHYTSWNPGGPGSACCRWPLAGLLVYSLL